MNRRTFVERGVAAAMSASINAAPPQRPNIMVLMTDQMQARVLDSNHPCVTPNLRRLADRGVRFTRAYTPNPICSPSRASLMTGLLPHNHGVTQVTSVCFPDEAVLRTSKAHWAQRFAAAGYNTGYFGKWHVERTNELRPFGWRTSCAQNTKEYDDLEKQLLAGRVPEQPLIDGMIKGLPGYQDFRMYGAGFLRRRDSLP